MIVYDYLCGGCDEHFTDVTFAPIGETHPYERCPYCNSRLLRGVANVTLGPIMQEHFNAAVNKPISSNRQFVDELKRKSEEMSARTGMEHRFVPVDMGDQKGLGVTDEGLDATAKVRRDKGRDLPTKKIIT
jgi:DNA-directed RNA polymerase subunit RPC12/RpoP